MDESRADALEGKRVFVLLCTSGEYDSWSRDLLGVFSSYKAAEEAPAGFDKLRATRWAEWQAWEHRRNDYLAALTPVRVTAPGGIFKDGFKHYGNDQYKEAELAAGQKPVFIASAEEYEIVEVMLDGIGDVLLPQAEGEARERPPIPSIR